MAGWLLAWNSSGMPVDATRWNAAVRAAQRRGESIVQHQREGISLAAWRRDSGEFPRSGTLAHPRLGVVVAWLGQILENEGDVTPSAIERLAAGQLDDAHLASLNGPFAAVVLGARPRDVAVVLDRYRHYPVWLHRAGDLTVVSTDYGAVVPFLERRELDDEAVEMFLRLGEHIGHASLVRGIELLPPAAVLRDEGSGPRLTTHYAVRHTGDDGADAGTIARRAGELLAQSVRRIERASPRLGITLSGGLDSRLILGLCERRREIPAFTWGLPGCRDIACAAAFARRIGAPHTVRNWDPAAFVPLWPTGADVTSGQLPIDSMFMLPFTGLLAQHADVILNGLAGDVVMGGNFLKLSWLRSTDVGALAADVWRWRVSERMDRAVDLLRAGRPASARQRWMAAITAERGASPAARLNDWLYPNRIFRTTNSGTSLLRLSVESHSPFWDRDFIDHAMRVPLHLRLKHRHYLRAMAHVCPDAAAVTWQRTGIAPRWGFVANGAAMAFQRYSRAALRRVGIHAYRSNAVADVSGWMRGPWRGPIRELLLSERHLERGIGDRAAMERILAEHDQGVDHTRLIGSLVSVECFARGMIDGGAA